MSIQSRIEKACAAALSTATFACSAVQYQEPETYQVPVQLVEKAEQFVRAHFPTDYYEKYIAYDAERSSFVPPDPLCRLKGAHCAPYKPHYRIVFTYDIPGQPFMSGIGFALDPEGNLIGDEADIHGLSNCRSDFHECEFPIGEQEARRIAAEAGLEEGIRPWEVGFGWNFKMRSFMWRVENTLEVKEAPWEASGRSVVIDANTGEVFEISSWYAQE